MKISNNYISLAAGVLALTLLGLPQSSMAQRFNHGGGGAPAARPAMSTPRPSAPAPRPEVTRPAPVARPAAAPEGRPNTINGGTYNFGNHDFNRGGNGAAVNVHGNVGARVNIPPANNTARVSVNVHDHVNVYHTGGYNGLHPYSYHPYHPYYWGPRWHPIGFLLSALTADAIRFSIGNQWYYYDDGCYYVPSAGGYSVVPPPINAIVSYLPEGYETTMVGNDEFYYYGGAFYVAIDQGYQVVAAPVGAVVTQLPIGAVDQQINGEDMLVYNNVYYQPISQDGQDAYEVVQVN